MRHVAMPCRCCSMAKAELRQCALLQMLRGVQNKAWAMSPIAGGPRCFKSQAGPCLLLQVLQDCPEVRRRP